MSDETSTYTFTFVVDVPRDPGVNTSLTACRRELSTAIAKLAVDPGDYLDNIVVDHSEIDWGTREQAEVSRILTGSTHG